MSWFLSGFLLSPLGNCYLGVRDSMSRKNGLEDEKDLLLEGGEEDVCFSF